MPGKQALDEIDGHILRRLQSDARAVAEDIGAEIGLSSAAVSRRVKRMRENGVIRGDVSVVDPKALGLAMTFVVGVELERERVDVIDAFRKQMRADVSVQQCYYVTGAYDFILIVHTADMEEYEAFTARTMFDNSNIRRFSTMVVMDRVKVGLTLPIPIS